MQLVFLDSTTRLAYDVSKREVDELSIAYQQDTNIAYRAIAQGAGAASWQQVSGTQAARAWGGGGGGGGGFPSGVTLKGSQNCSANPNYPSAIAGDGYRVTVAGKIGGASGTVVEVGDFYVASAANAGGTQAAVGTSWFVQQANIDGAVTGPASATDNAVMRFDGTGGKTAQDSKATVTDTGAVYPADAAATPALQTALGLRAGTAAAADASGADGELYFKADLSIWQRISAAWVRFLVAFATNTGLGRSALAALTSGSNNTAVGASALSTIATGTDGTAVGKDALKVATGSNNTAVGSLAGDAITSGSENTALGVNALGALQTGNNNTVVGVNAGAAYTGNFLTAMGRDAALALTTGAETVAIGYFALASEVAGAGNTAVGRAALSTQNGGNDNTAFGNAAGEAVTTGDGNTFLGSRTGDDLTTGSENILIGKDVQASAVGASNELNIGGLIKGVLPAGTEQVQVLGPFYASSGANPSAFQTVCGLFAGTGVPSDSTGQNGDYYLRADGGAATHLYFKAAGVWAGVI